MIFVNGDASNSVHERLFHRKAAKLRDYLFGSTASTVSAVKKCILFNEWASWMRFVDRRQKMLFKCTFISSGKLLLHTESAVNLSVWEAVGWMSYHSKKPHHSSSHRIVKSFDKLYRSALSTTAGSNQCNSLSCRDLKRVQRRLSRTQVRSDASRDWIMKGLRLEWSFTVGDVPQPSQQGWSRLCFSIFKFQF